MAQRRVKYNKNSWVFPNDDLNDFFNHEDQPEGLAPQGKFDYRLMFVKNPKIVYDYKHHVEICIKNSGRCRNWQNGNFAPIPLGHFRGIMKYCFNVSTFYNMYYNSMVEAASYLKSMPMNICSAEQFLKESIFIWYF